MKNPSPRATTHARLAPQQVQTAAVEVRGRTHAGSSIVDALNQLGVSPPDLVAILEALKQAGSLKADLVVI